MTTHCVNIFIQTLFKSLAALSLLAGAAAWAGPYPWVPLHARDIEVIPDPRVEAGIRLELIRRARSTIDVVTYDQRLDPAIGMPLLAALREAADRGVRVRFMNAWFTELVSDLHQLVPRFLTEPPAREPVQVRVVGGFQGHKRGWGYIDGIHDKLVVIDGAAALTTGRGQSDFYLRWLDTAFLMRGALVGQSEQAFEQLWADTGLDNPIYSRSGHYLTSPIPRPILKEVELDGSESAELRRLTAWLDEAPSSDPVGRARVLHHDFVHQLRALPGRPRGYSYAARVRLLDDPVVDALSELIAETASEVRFTTLSVIPHPKLRAALDAALDRRVPIRILTNGRSMYKTVTPVPAPWIVSLPYMEEALRRGARISAMQLGPADPWTFLHRKTAIVGDTVIFGSHNFNLPSTVANDEISFEVENPDLAQTLGELFDDAFEKYGVPQSAWGIHRQKRFTGFERWLFSPLMGIF